MKNSKNTIRQIFVLIMVFGGFGFIYSNSAASSPIYADNLGDRLQDLQHARDGSTLLTSIVQISMVLAGMALIALSIYAGFVMLTSQGNPEKINEAREILTNAILGFALIALSVGILLIISEVLQLPGM